MSGSQEWRPIASMSTRRSSVGVGVLGGLIYAVGGYDGNSRQCLASVEVYNPDQGENTTSLCPSSYFLISILFHKGFTLSPDTNIFIRYLVSSIRHVSTEEWSRGGSAAWSSLQRGWSRWSPGEEKCGVLQQRQQQVDSCC